MEELYQQFDQISSGQISSPANPQDAVAQSPTRLPESGRSSGRYQLMIERGELLEQNVSSKSPSIAYQRFIPSTEDVESSSLLKCVLAAHPQCHR